MQTYPINAATLFLLYFWQIHIQSPNSPIFPPSNILCYAIVLELFHDVR